MSSVTPKPAGYRQFAVDTVRVLVIGPRTLDDEEFATLVADGVVLARAARSVLVSIVGEPSMDPSRRKALSEAGLLDKPAAVLTDSAKVRGVLTALSWLGGKNRGFRPNDWDAAFEFLRVREESRGELRALVEKSRAELIGGSARDSQRPALSGTRDKAT